MIKKNLDELLEEYHLPIRELDRTLKRFVKYSIGGGLIMSLTMLSLKYDIHKSFHELDKQVTENAQRIERIEQGGFYIADPCYRNVEGDVYEVLPCEE